MPIDPANPPDQITNPDAAIPVYVVSGGGGGSPAAPAYGSATNAMQINNGSNAFGATNFYGNYKLGGPNNSDDFYNSLNYYNGNSQLYPWFSGSTGTIFEIIDSYTGNSNSLTAGYFYGSTTNANSGLSIQSGCYNDGNNWVFDEANTYPVQMFLGTSTGNVALTLWTANATGSSGATVPFVQSLAIDKDGGVFLSDSINGSKGHGTLNATGLYVDGVQVAAGVQTVETLPTASAGARAFVSNSSVPAIGNFGVPVVTGGAFTVPVWCDGAIWYIG